MPRRTSSAVKKEVPAEDVKPEKGSTPRRSGRAVTKSDNASQEAERSRRSSTAAQTAASVAESRVTRSRNSRRDSTSPVSERRSAGREAGVESPASRVRSSRRSTGRINYKESDGEEEVATPKNEDNFESNEEFDESDSDEKNKQKIKKSTKPQPKAGSVRQKGKSSKGAKRGRPAKKRAEPEEQDTVDLSDDSDEHSDEASSRKKGKDVAPQGDSEDVSGAGRKRSRVATTPEATEKSSRRSSRGSVGKAAPSKAEPVHKRPSRNKQVKKYTEVDEEFSDAKSEDEDEDDDAEYEVETKKESTRKRKREHEPESNKRPKREKVVIDVEENEPDEDDSQSEKKDVVEVKGSDAMENTGDDSSDEPMEIDESFTETTPKKKEKDSSSSADVKEEGKDAKRDDAKVVLDGVGEKQLQDSKQVNSAGQSPSRSEDSQEDKEADEDVEDDMETSRPLESVAKVKENASENKTDSAGMDKIEDKDADVSSKTEEGGQGNTAPNESKSESSNAVHDNTFLSKEQAANSSINGEEEEEETAVPSKDAAAPDAKSSFQYQNSTLPKANGTHDDVNAEDSQRTLPGEPVSAFPGRQYVLNSRVSEDTRSSLKEKTFGLASYNLSSAVINQDKLVHELSKLHASVICLQEVSESLFHEVLESKFDVLGYKAVTSWPKQCDAGLVTFYKASVFRLSKVLEAPVQKLISQALETSNLDENDKQAVSECFDKCGNVLITQLSTVLGSDAVTVANVRIPSCSVGLNALQVSCLTRKIAAMPEHVKPLLICGEFNMEENEVPYQLLKSGYLTDHMLEELKSRTDGSESAALVKLVQNVSQSPSCAMCSCYSLVLGKELQMPELKSTSPDLLWVCADDLRTIGVLDVSHDPAEQQKDHHASLKADIAFSI